MSKKLLLKELIHLQENGPDHLALGICDSLPHKEGGFLKKYGGYLFSSWVHFSGYIMYPVPHPDGSIFGYADTDNVWTGEYGDLRKDLLNHMINTLKEELGDEKNIKDSINNIRVYPNIPLGVRYIMVYSYRYP